MNSWLGHAGGIGRRRESGPVITLSGDTDLVSVARLSSLISGATLGLTLDAPGLSFADTASIRTLMLAARTLKERGGRLVLLHPRRSVACEARGVWLPAAPTGCLGFAVWWRRADAARPRTWTAAQPAVPTDETGPASRARS